MNATTNPVRLLLWLLLALPAVVQAQFTYTTNNNQITITGAFGQGGPLIIPDTIDGLPVTAIGREAFYDYSGISSVTIPNSVTSIGSYAFSHCFNLINITVAESNPTYSSLNGVLFDKAQATLLQFPAGQGGSYSIPDSVTAIGNYAFFYSPDLTNVTIPNSVTTVGNEAFSACTRLAGITIGSSVTTIGPYAFAHCFRLSSVAIPNSVTTIGDGVLTDCTDLINISVEQSNPAYSSLNGVLFDKPQAKLLQFPAGQGGTYNIPDSVTTIGVLAFGSCTGLTGVTIPNSVTTIGLYAFSDCERLAEVTIPNGVTAIEDGTFNWCTGLTGVTLPTSLTTVGESAFNYCLSLSSLTVPDSVTRIGAEAFKDCGSLRSVTIGNSVTTLGNGAFSGCYRLTSVTIPDSVTSIGVSAFNSCNGLTIVTVGNSVTTLADAAFSGCSGLNGIFFRGNAPSAGSSAFFQANDATVFYLTDSSGWNATFADRPTAVWHPQIQIGGADFGVKAGQFGFTMNWASGRTVVVEATSDLTQPVWTPVSTNTLAAGTAYFSDPQWVNYPSRLYRLRMP
jgi:Flp pilus assembly protein protease CpaA